MNWTMGRYIDELDDEGRDRLITARGLVPHFLTSPEGGCLVGCASGVTAGLHDCWSVRFVVLHGEALEAGVGERFNRAVARFGLERVVRAIKARAARGNAPKLEPVVDREHVYGD